MLDTEGTIAEQGHFEVLNGTGGYISRFNLSPPDWSYESTDSPSSTSSFDKETNSEGDVLESDEHLEAAANKQTGDLSIYKYYMNSVGWFAVLIFVVFISAFVFCISFPSKLRHTLSRWGGKWLIISLPRYLGQMVGGI